MVCTSERFARNEDGKAVGLETVTTVFDDVSECDTLVYGSYAFVRSRRIPLHRAPQTSHVRMAFSDP
jgi:hypothetical protein